MTPASSRPGTLPRLVLWGLLALTPALPARGQSPSLHPLGRRIAERLQQSAGVVAGIYLKDLGDGRELAINADSSFHAASTMKVPVMIEYFRHVDAGAIAPDARVVLANRFASIVDGSPYSLDAGEDSDSALYGRVGREVAVRELVDRMITRSSNLATNAVIALVGAGKADSTAHALGARSIRVLRGVEDGKAFRAGLNNTTTARDLGALLEAIVSGRAASPTSTQSMLDVLSRQEFNDEIPAGLPPGTRVAHKTGWITATMHDAAIVFPPSRPPFVLVVLTGGVKDEQAGRTLIQDIARFTWETLVSH